MEFLGVIFSLAFFVYFPIAGITAMMLSWRIRDFGHQGVNPLIIFCWKAYTLIMLTTSVIFLLLQVMAVVTNQLSLFGAALAGLPTVLVYCFTIYLEWQCFQLLRALNVGDDYILPQTLQNRVHLIRIGGSILLGMPLLIFVSVLVYLAPLFFLVLVFTCCLLNVLALNKRSRETELLWLITFCVEKNIPLATEIDRYSKTMSGRYRNRLLNFSSRLHSGDSLSEAMAYSPGLLPQSAIVSVHIGEETKSPGIALRDAAVRATKRLHDTSDKSNLANLILYLTIILSLQFIITGFIMYFIVPKFKQIFLDFGIELPPITRSLIDASDLVYSYFYLFFPIFSLPVMILALLYFGNYFGWYNLRIPFITGWFPRLNTPHCLRQIAQAVAVESPPLIALDSVGNYHLWTDVRQQAQSAAIRIRQGHNFWESLQEADVISSAEAGLCSTAEKLGNLPYVLRTLADTIEQRGIRRMRYFTEICKPILVCILAILVGYTVLALFMPIIQLLLKYA
ncbi:Type II secretion system protein F [Gimesia panareensis]|uniref:Type II secretion system protein F n=1 Tax=Gimesia panareensis TaxID=2527978 RepID=A0A518FYS7_9PLAN|nr:type II secretion system F family protein [Gimesia panareensis]QDV21404.1 Type II secretion system protein F [Gimesia panareensis]